MKLTDCLKSAVLETSTAKVIRLKCIETITHAIHVTVLIASIEVSEESGLY